MQMKQDIPKGFDKPTALPFRVTEKEEWQKNNRDWWENHPMRYDWRDAIEYNEFSKEYYNEIDRRFFEKVSKFMPYKKIPFDSLIPFEQLHDKHVLEIGIGSGCHAQLLATHSKNFVGIDITSSAVERTRKRLEQYDIEADIRIMDAEEMSFPDNTFDFLWTWGVIHHSSNTEKVLKEMARVLKPGGTAITMVYHRSFWNYYIMNGLFRGVILGDLFKTKSLHKTVQRNTDGAIARYYKCSEWKALTSKYFTVNKIKVFGAKEEIVLLPGGRIKNTIMRLIPNRVSRFLTNTLRTGSFLVSILTKEDS